MADTQAKPPRWWPGFRRDHPLARGCVCYWPLWEGQAGMAYDVANPFDTGNHMTAVNGPIWTPSSRGQAMLFDDASSQYLRLASAVVAGRPVTMSCWFYADDIANPLAAMAIGKSTDDQPFLELQLRGNIGGDPVGAVDRDDSNVIGIADTTTGYSINTWHHGVAVFESTTSRLAYIDGGSVGTDSTVLGGHTGLDRTAIGGRERSGATLHFSGMIENAAIWNRALIASEVAELYQDPCALIRPPSTITTFAGAATAKWRPLSLMGVG